MHAYEVLQNKSLIDMSRRTCLYCGFMGLHLCGKWQAASELEMCLQQQFEYLMCTDRSGVNDNDKLQPLMRALSLRKYARVGVGAMRHEL